MGGCEKMEMKDSQMKSSIIIDNRKVNVMDYGQIPENPAWKIDSHKHDFFELHYIANGSGTNISPDGHIPLESGTLYIAKPGETHAQVSNPKDPMKLFYAGFYIDSLDSKEPWELEYAISILQLQSRIVFNRFYPIEPIVARIVKEMNERREHSSIMINHLFSQLFIEVFRSLKERFSLDESGKGSNIEMIRSTVEYMKQHLSEPYDNALLANRVCMSTSHFRRLFSQTVGIPPAKYFLLMRIEFAKSLLLGSRSVTDTAEIVGFESVEHFSKTFKKCVGLCPSHYQKHRDEEQSRHPEILLTDFR
jgi:AraC-like DNA-binding protein/mannose-6-phosphate isomerase-like protein (cupin superfamily)